MPQSDAPDPGDMSFKDAAGQTDAGDSVAEEATEDEVLDIVTAGAEPRTFNDNAKRGADKAKAPVQKSADAQPDEADPHVDKQLDHGLDETFPASDPVSINPGAD